MACRAVSDTFAVWHAQGKNKNRHMRPVAWGAIFGHTVDLSSLPRTLCNAPCYTIQHDTNSVMSFCFSRPRKSFEVRIKTFCPKLNCVVYSWSREETSSDDFTCSKAFVTCFSTSTYSNHDPTKVENHGYRNWMFFLLCDATLATARNLNAQIAKNSF